MKTIAMFNNKGGVGKTTLVCNTANYYAKVLNKKVLLIDADPQCNSTISVMEDTEFEDVYYHKSKETIYNLIEPLFDGEGYNRTISPTRQSNYQIDFMIGDPRLSLFEDFLSSEWKDTLSGNVRGAKTTLVFYDLLKKFNSYDYIFFDMGPSLGAINRAILLACDYFISPMTSDIFSLLAIENIGKILKEWKDKFFIAVDQHTELQRIETDLRKVWKIKFGGYVLLEYTAKVVEGKRESVKAFEQIISRIPLIIEENLVNTINDTPVQI